MHYKSCHKCSDNIAFPWKNEKVSLCLINFCVLYDKNISQDEIISDIWESCLSPSYSPLLRFKILNWSSSCLFIFKCYESHKSLTILLKYYSKNFRAYRHVVWLDEKIKSIFYILNITSTNAKGCNEKMISKI